MMKVKAFRTCVISCALVALIVPAGYADSGGIPVLQQQISQLEAQVAQLQALISSLQKPILQGNFTWASDLGIVSGAPLVVFVGGGYSNYGVRTAFNASMTLFWTITPVCYVTPCSPTVQRILGIFSLGNVGGRTTHPFTLTIPVSSNPLPFTVDSIGATFTWNSA